MILMLHVIAGVLSIGFGATAAIQSNREFLRAQLIAFGFTIISGISLVILNPSALVHLCISGTVFSAISIVLAVVARRRLAYTV